MRILLLKGGPGSGNFGHTGRPGSVGGSAPSVDSLPVSLPVNHLPASAGIATAQQARLYWQQNLSGRPAQVTMRAGQGIYSVRVDFPADNAHAWTRKAMAGETADAFDQPAREKGPRTFDAVRAQMMDRLVPTLAAPWKVLGQRGSDVLIQYGRLPNGGAYTAALTIKSVGHYEFASAYPRTKTEIDRLIREFRSHPPAGLPGNTLAKSEAPPDGSGGACTGLPITAPSGRGTMSPLHPVAIPQGEYPLAAGRYLHAFLGIFKSLGAGERWITIHAPGHEKGQPLLIKEQPDGSAKVIGGAGGKLSHLRLTEVRSEADYKSGLRQRQVTRREEQGRSRERDRADGLTANKKVARDAVGEQLRTHERKFVGTVAAALGWKPEDTRFAVEKFANATPAAQKAAEQKHGRELFAQASRAVDHQRHRLVQDAETRAEGGLGEVPLTTATPDQISVQDLDPIAAGTAGLGFDPGYGKRAE